MIKYPFPGLYPNYFCLTKKKSFAFDYCLVLAFRFLRGGGAEGVVLGFFAQLGLAGKPFLFADFIPFKSLVPTLFLSPHPICQVFSPARSFRSGCLKHFQLPLYLNFAGPGQSVFSFSLDTLLFSLLLLSCLLNSTITQVIFIMPAVSPWALIAARGSYLHSLLAFFSLPLKYSP